LELGTEIKRTIISEDPISNLLMFVLELNLKLILAKYHSRKIIIMLMGLP
jgi:hypothetical protein